ncbi:hypothetical protein SNEBB_006830, partial [Seison nebaliae]
MDVVTQMEFSPDEKLLTIGDDKGKIIIWEYIQNRNLIEFHDHKQQITLISYHPRLWYLITGSVDRILKIYDLESIQSENSQKKEISNHQIKLCSTPTHLVFHENDKHFYLSLNDQLRVYDWPTLNNIETLIIPWKSLSDMIYVSNQLISVTHSLGNFTIFVVDLLTIENSTNISSSFINENKRIIDKSSKRNDITLTLNELNIEDSNENAEKISDDEIDNRTNEIHNFNQYYHAISNKEKFIPKRKWKRRKIFYEISDESSDDFYSADELTDEKSKKIYSFDNCLSINRRTIHEINFFKSKTTIDRLPSPATSELKKSTEEIKTDKIIDFDPKDLERGRFMLSSRQVLKKFFEKRLEICNEIESITKNSQSSMELINYLSSTRDVLIIQRVLNSYRNEKNIWSISTALATVPYVVPLLE